MMAMAAGLGAERIGTLASQPAPAWLAWLAIPMLLFLMALMVVLIWRLILNSRGQEAETLARARNSAEIARAQVVLRRSVEELIRSNEELEKIAYVASHDLKEPVRMVNAYVSRLRDQYQGQLDEKADQYIAFAVEGAERMQVLIHDLLAYSRLGFQPQAFLPTNAESALGMALAGLKGDLDQARARITSDPLPVLHADGTQLTQVFQNLIGNAIKFRAKEVPEIHVGFERRGDHALFTVQDNGIGMDPISSSRIFDLFQRLNPRENYPGSGVGLSLCKKIVERHGGRIWVESQPGAGTTFFFTIQETVRRKG